MAEIKPAACVVWAHHSPAQEKYCPGQYGSYTASVINLSNLSMYMRSIQTEELDVFYMLVSKVFIFIKLLTFFTL